MIIKIVLEITLGLYDLLLLWNIQVKFVQRMTIHKRTVAIILNTALFRATIILSIHLYSFTDQYSRNVCFTCYAQLIVASFVVFLNGHNWRHGRWINCAVWTSMHINASNHFPSTTTASIPINWTLKVDPTAMFVALKWRMKIKMHCYFYVSN